MNTQEKLNLLKQLLTFACGILIAHGVLTETQAQSAISDIFVILPSAVGLGSIGWSVYSHWNMVKVPEHAVLGAAANASAQVKKVVALFAVLTLAGLGYAHAADLQDKASAFTLPTVPSNPCTATSCTGLYGGAFFGGLGDNVNVLGNGINGSFNSGGMLPGVDVGWQYFDGKFYLGLEADVGYQFASSQALAGAVGSFNGPFGIVQAKVGASLAALAPSLVSSTSSLPLTIITPYLAGGEMMQQHGGTGGVGGGGILFQLGTDGANFLDVEYLNGGGAGSTGNSTATDNNIFRVGLDHLF